MDELGSNSDSDDDLLNFQAFTPNKKQKREIESGVPSRASSPCKKVEKIVSAESKALKIVSCASVPLQIKHPNSLYWHKEVKKKGRKRTALVQWHPCRMCHPDDATGLDLPEKWDQNKKALIQYIEKTGFKDLSLIARTSLVPYHGKKDNEEIADEDIAHEWCSEKMKELSSRNHKSKKKHFQDDTSIIAMELYMKKILNTAVERMQEEKKRKDSEEETGREMKLVSSTTRCINEESQLSSSSAIISQSQDVAESDHDEYSSDDSSNVMRRRKKKHIRLRPGDTIAFYQPNMVHGDRRAYTEAVIEAIDCKKDLVLTLRGGSFLDRNQKVKRIKKCFRGKQEDDDGNWTTVRDFKLASAKLKGPSGVKAEAKRLREIVERQKQITKEKLKKEGLGGFGGFFR